MFRSCLMRLLAVPLIVLLLVGIFEAVAVWKAKERTPAVLAQVAARPLRLDQLPENRRAWLIAIEDPGFHRHRGVDFSTPGAGLTTIPQALVRQLYFDRFAPGFDSVEQALIARFVFDPAVPKDEQLEIFLNHASFGTVAGRPVIGFADAARSFYGRELAQLSDAEFLTLVAMLIAPGDLNPRDHPIESAERVGRIQALLAGRCKPANLFDVRYDACRGL